MHVDDAIFEYVGRPRRGDPVDLPELRLGVSTRGALALIRAGRALAVTQGRPFVTVDDVKSLAPAALGHRMLLTPDAELRGVQTIDLVDRLLDSVAGADRRHAPAWRVTRRSATDRRRAARPADARRHRDRGRSAPSPTSSGGSSGGSS